MFDFFFNKVSEKVSEHIKEELPGLIRDNLEPAIKEVLSDMASHAFEATADVAITYVAPGVGILVILYKGGRLMRHVKVIRQVRKKGQWDDHRTSKQ